jgi:hypothetical protein
MIPPHVLLYIPNWYFDNKNNMYLKVRAADNNSVLCSDLQAWSLSTPVNNFTPNTLKTSTITLARSGSFCCLPLGRGSTLQIVLVRFRLILQSSDQQARR